MKLKEKLGAALELPGELMSDIAKITVVGNREICIENYKGIIEYTPTSIRISCGSYQLGVFGANLELKTATGEVLYIAGAVEKLEWIA